MNKPHVELFTAAQIIVKEVIHVVVPLGPAASARTSSTTGYQHIDKMVIIVIQISIFKL